MMETISGLRNELAQAQRQLAQVIDPTAIIKSNVDSFILEDQISWLKQKISDYENSDL